MVYCLKRGYLYRVHEKQLVEPGHPNTVWLDPQKARPFDGQTFSKPPAQLGSSLSRISSIFLRTNPLRRLRGPLNYVRLHPKEYSLLFSVEYFARRKSGPWRFGFGCHARVSKMGCSQTIHRPYAQIFLPRSEEHTSELQ